MTTIIYALFDGKYPSAGDAASARAEVYVGKTTVLHALAGSETEIQAALRVLQEHQTNPSRHGKLLENMLQRNATTAVGILTSVSGSLQGNPTNEERYWMNELERAGALITNTLR